MGQILYFRTIPGEAVAAGIFGTNILTVLKYFILEISIQIQIDLKTFRATYGSSLKDKFYMKFDDTVFKIFPPLWCIQYLCSTYCCGSRLAF